MQRRDGGDAGVARGGVHLGDLRVAGQGEGQGVLAAAGADDEGLHGSQPSARSGTCARRDGAPSTGGALLRGACYLRTVTLVMLDAA